MLNKISSFFFLLIVVTSFLYCESHKSDKQLFLTFVEQAIDAKDKGNFEKALDLCNKALLYDSSKSFSFVLKGQIESSLERDQLAVKSFSKAIKIDQENVSAYFHRGISYYLLDLDSMSLIDYSEAIMLKKSNKVVYIEELKKEHLSLEDQTDIPLHKIKYFRGLSLMQLRKFDDAKEDFLYSLLSNYEQNKSLIYIGISYINLGQFNKGCEFLMKASVVNDSLASSYLRRYCTK